MKPWKFLFGALASMAVLSGCNLGASPTSGGGTEVDGLYGSVVDFRGTPVPYAWVKVFPDDAAGLSRASASTVAVRDSVQADAQGRYLLPRLPSGRYALLATSTRNDTVLTVLVRAIERTSGGGDSLAIVLHPGGVISVQVHTGSGPLASAQCSIAGVPLPPAVSDSAGTCRLNGLPAGSYRVTVAYPGLGTVLTGLVQVTPGQVTAGGFTVLGGGSGVLPNAPTPWSPTANSVISGGTAIVAWTHPESLDVDYRLQIAQDSGFASLVLDTVMAARSHPFSMQAGATYYWRVSARNAHGFGAYSARRRFTQGTLIDTLMASRDASYYSGIPGSLGGLSSSAGAGAMAASLIGFDSLQATLAGRTPVRVELILQAFSSVTGTHSIEVVGIPAESLWIEDNGHWFYHAGVKVNNFDYVYGLFPEYVPPSGSVRPEDAVHESSQRIAQAIWNRQGSFGPVVPWTGSVPKGNDRYVLLEQTATVKIDVTEIVLGAGRSSLALRSGFGTNAGDFSFYTRNHVSKAYAPRLVITYP